MTDRVERHRSESLRGIDARQVLDNPAFKEAHRLLQEEIVNQWKACPVRDAEGQVLLLQLAKLATKFERILSGMVETGRMADLELERDRSESKAKQLFRRVF